MNEKSLFSFPFVSFSSAAQEDMKARLEDLESQVRLGTDTIASLTQTIAVLESERAQLNSGMSLLHMIIFVDVKA